MEIRLKDESGKSIDTLLEKTIALTNEVQVPPTPESPDILKDVEIDLETVPEHKVLKTVPAESKLADLPSKSDDKSGDKATDERSVTGVAGEKTSEVASAAADKAEDGLSEEGDAGVVSQIKDASEKLVSAVCKKTDAITAKAGDLASASMSGLEDAGKKLKEMAGGLQELCIGNVKEGGKDEMSAEDKSYKEKIKSMAGDLLSSVMSESERIVKQTVGESAADQEITDRENRSEVKEVTDKAENESEKQMEDKEARSAWEKSSVENEEGKTAEDSRTDSNSVAASDSMKAALDAAKEALSVAAENLSDKVNGMLPSEKEVRAATESLADKSKEVAEAVSEKGADPIAEVKKV